METAPILDRVLHLAIFVSTVSAVGVVGLAIIERLAGSAAPVIRRRHIAVAIVVLLAAVAAERIFHVIEG